MPKTNIVQHEIKDNFLLINNKKHYGLDVTKIAVGVENPQNTEILKNPDTGLNYSRNAVEAQEIYNALAQKKSCWFILDLETGTRGWFPGCEIHGDILGHFEIKEAEDDNSATLLESENVTLKILNIFDLEDCAGLTWLKVTHAGITGYVKKSLVTNLSYSNPF